MQLRPSNTTLPTSQENPDGSTIVTLYFDLPFDDDLKTDMQDTYNSLASYIGTGNYTLQQPVALSNGGFSISYNKGSIPSNPQLQPAASAIALATAINPVLGLITANGAEIGDTLSNAVINTVKTFNGGTVNSPSIGGEGLFSDILTSGIVILGILFIGFLFLGRK